MKFEAKRILTLLLLLVLVIVPPAGLADESPWDDGYDGIQALPVDEAVPEERESELADLTGAPGEAALSAEADDEAQQEAPDDAAGPAEPSPSEEGSAENPAATEEPGSPAATEEPGTPTATEGPVVPEQPDPVPPEETQEIAYPALAVTSLKLGVKEKVTLALEGGVAAQSVGAVFSSSKPGVASVGRSTGVVKAKKKGTATITMTVQGTVSTCAVTVLKAPKKVTLSLKKLEMGVKEQRQLKAKLPSRTASAITFSTSNDKVATVDGDGNITAHKKGTAVITARTFNNRKASCKVTVRAAPKSVSLDPATLSLWVNDTHTLKPELNKKSAGAYSYTVSDETVVSIKGDKLTALSEGVATVCVTTYNGKSAQMRVKVSRKPVYRALLVGESDFPGSGMPSLPAEKDVALMKKMLTSVKGPVKTKWNVTVRTNRTAAQIYGDIQTAYAGAQEGDVSLFYISTHGDETLTLDSAFPEYVGCLQTYPDIRYFFWYDRNTLTLPTLAQWLREIPGQVIVLIDSCGSGAAIYDSKEVSAPALPYDSFGEAVIDAFQAQDKGVMAPGGEEGAFVVQNKFYVLTSCDYLETGWSEANKYSYFTKWLTDGIGTSGRMPADTDKNRLTTLKELYKYMKKRAGKKVFVYRGIRYQQHIQVYPSDSSFALFYRK